MKIIIPMAGMGTRMRPHTLVTPKPLLKIAGKSLIERIVLELNNSTGRAINEIHYVIGEFGNNVEKNLIEIAEGIDAKGFIHYQHEALGTAHAVLCTDNALKDEILIAFADTLFMGNINIEDKEDAIIWTSKVKNPERYGVVLTNSDDFIIDFIEKPKNFVSDKAIIGTYYFKKGELLKDAIESLINEERKVKNEFQLTDALEDLKKAGLKFKCKVIEKWLDCGNKMEFLRSNNHILSTNSYNVNDEYSGSKIIKPLYIGENVIIENSIIGPNISIEKNCMVKNSELRDSIIGNNTIIESCKLGNSIIGNFCKIKNARGIVNIGDYSEYEGF